MQTSDSSFYSLEKLAGPPDVEPLEIKEIDRYRQGAYKSYEAFLRGRLLELEATRESRWPRDYSSVEAYLRSVEPLRERLKAMLGFWAEPAERAPVQRRDRETLYETAAYIVERFWLEIIPGLETYAIEVVPRTPGPHPGLIAQHGYAGTPEAVVGLTPNANGDDYVYRSLGLRAVERGFHVVAVHHPSGYGSTEEALPTIPGFEPYRNYGKNRLHRMALMAGGTLFGLDMMASSRGVDLLLQCDDVDPARIGMYGLSQGGQSALFLPALDTRIQATVCSAYFSHRLLSLVGPHRAGTYLDSQEEDKFFSDVVRLYSDADIASLIVPRAFAVEAGQLDTSVDFEKAVAEFERARAHYDQLGLGDKIEFIPHAAGHIPATARSFEFLSEHLRR